MFTENREKGTAAVEFALILPMLLLMLFVIIEFGFIFYDKAVLTNASREGARKGILARDPRVSAATISTTVGAYCARNLISFGPSSVPTTSISGAPCPASDDDITVTVRYPYNFLVLPNFLTTVTGPINLSATTVMRCE
jgi:Flp pilus assembly protein TadG